MLDVAVTVLRYRITPRRLAASRVFAAAVTGAGVADADSDAVAAVTAEANCCRVSEYQTTHVTMKSRAVEPLMTKQGSVSQPLRRRD